MNVAPTLPAARGSLPPEGALRLRSGEASPAAPTCKFGSDFSAEFGSTLRVVRVVRGLSLRLGAIE
jgi:hypothetical protein